MAEDDFDFKKAMQHVRPLEQDTHKPFSSKPKAKKSSKNTPPMQTHHIPYEYDFNLINQDNWVDGETKAAFKRPGVQKRVLDDLRRRQIPYEDRIDLHHFTSGEAMLMIDRFIDQCLADNIRCVLVIHGKGYMSRKEKPIIKNILIEHLRNNSYVLAYHSAQPRDGGTGALYVLIKASHKV
jgi:DNA-nicking Smr family endonuclease